MNYRLRQDNQKGPRRSCIACRSEADKAELLRFVAGPDKTLLVDYRHRLPGRGCYTHIDPRCISQAVKRQAFRRGLRVPVEMPETGELLEQVRRAMVVRTGNLLGMARKSGQLICGSNAVSESLRTAEQVSLIVLAEDMSPAIARRLVNLAERRQLLAVQLFTKQELGQLLGQHEFSAVAVRRGHLAAALVQELNRFRILAREN